MSITAIPRRAKVKNVQKSKKKKVKWGFANQKLYMQET